MTPPHCAQRKVIRSTHGLCNSKLSGIFSKAFSTSSALLPTAFFCLQLWHVQIGSGVPQMRSREMHHGLPSLRKETKRFLGSSKKYSIFPAASSTLLFILSVLRKYSFLASQTSLWCERQQVGYSCFVFFTSTKAFLFRSSSTTG